jgi:nitrate/TMAO reductase-like tetraheme cytochrome c subunit
MTDDQTPDQQPSPEESVTGAPAESATSAAGGGKHPKHGRRQLFDVNIPRAWLYGLLTAIVVLLAGATLFFAALTDPRTCGLCHVIKAEVDSYKTSVHAQNGVVCQDCHTKPGVFNYFVHNLQSLTHVYEYVSGKYQKPLVTFVGTADCVRCHPKDEIEKDVIIGNIRVNHKGIRDSGMQCVTCHSDVVHGNAAPVGARPLESVMSICGQCHNGVKQSRKCSICHINGVPPGSVTVSMHVKINPAQCTECHNKTFCSKCHNNIQMPHQSGWRAAHGPIVVNRGSAVCAKCHQSKDPKFCTSCHGLQMPHPSTWPQAHPARAKADPALCVKCHGNNSCIRCHGLQMPHPADWLGQHPTTYKADPSLCSKCHSTSFCVNCHGVSLPHSSAFISDHFVAALADGGVCVKCHGNGGAGPAGCFGGSCHTKGGAPAVP